MTVGINMNSGEHHPSDATSKRRIMESAEWVTEGLDYCRDTGRWAEWEQRLLAHIAQGNTLEIMDGVQYACDVLQCPWTALEPPLLDWLCAGGSVYVDEECLEAFKMYLEHIGESETLEAEILRRRLSAPALFYAKRVIQGRWREAEDIILDADTPHQEAVVYGYKGNSDRVENQISLYARDLIGGRWRAFEERVRRCECHPATVVWYTRRIIGSSWKQGENCLLQLPHAKHTSHALVGYARHIHKGRWRAAEETIARSPSASRRYATQIVRRQWQDWTTEELERSTCWMCLYAKQHLGSGRGMGQLPEILHDLMLRHAVLNGTDKDRWVKRYFKGLKS